MSANDQTMEYDSRDPMAMFMQVSQANDVELRLSAMSELSTIAEALGVERTRSELLPFLGWIQHDVDAVMQSLAEQLGDFSSFVGGPSFAMYLLPPLEYLATVVEDDVRCQALASLRNVVGELSVQDLETSVLPMVQRLASNLCTARSSACGLISVCYRRLTNPLLKEKLRAGFETMCRDESALVRRSAALELPEFAKVMEPEHLRTVIMTNFVRLAHDDKEIVSLPMMGAGISIAQLLSLEEVQRVILPTLRTFSTSFSWRVRNMMAKNLLDLQMVVGSELIRTELVTVLQFLLRDLEPEVRVCAILQLKAFCNNLDADEQDVIFMNSFLPYISNLVRDTTPYVRYTMASVIVSLSDFLGVQQILNHLVPLILRQLKDEVAYVRESIISNLDYLIDAIGMQHLLEYMLPAFIELATDPVWRVRVAISSYIPALAKEMGTYHFDQTLRGICLAWLHDRVYAVRVAAIKTIKELVELFGVPWAQRSIIPTILSMSQSGNHFYKTTFLFCANALAELITTQQLLPNVLLLANDAVANVRSTVAKTLKKISPFVNNTAFYAQLLPTLKNLNEDEDEEVKHFAAQAILFLEDRVAASSPSWEILDED